MKHDELLAEIDRLDVVLTDSYGMSALRAVVELHKPYDSITQGLCCAECGDGMTEFFDYPCSTIQAIEKEF